MSQAACSKNSTFTASKGNSILPSEVRTSTPAFSSAVQSVIDDPGDGVEDFDEA